MQALGKTVKDDTSATTHSTEDIQQLSRYAESSYELTSQDEERVLIRSKRRWVLNTIELEEESPGPYPRKLTELHNDKHLNYSIKFKISGQGVTEDPKDLFKINENTGEIFVYRPIDRENCSILNVRFDVMDKNTGTILDKTLAFNVAIKDINDNPPRFSHEILPVEIPENTKEGQLPFSLQAKDIDEQDNDNSRISMRIESQEPALPKISLVSITDGKSSMITNLIFTGCFDYDKIKTYKLLIKAWDHGTPSLSTTTTVNIAITDSNTHPPVFAAPNFNASVLEMETNKVILRIPVKDQDTPNTPASRAVFTILKGNEEGNYKIETDPVTNEGVLTVIKGKDYERTTLTELEIAVDNEEPFFLCVDGKPVTPIPEALKRSGTTKVAVKVIDVNDPPVFQNKLQRVYRVEEEEPGDVLYTPTVTDEDSDIAKLKYELVEDPAKWMSINPKTGKITLAKKIDRESPHVRNSTYTVTMRVIDDGEPPATSTGTLVVHIGDKNDNTPHLISNTSVMCGNKADRVKLSAEDADIFPYSGPFIFTLDNDDPQLKSQWKLEQSPESGNVLVSLNRLPYGNYSVPLKIADQQGALGHDVLKVVVCDCGKGDTCLGPLPRYTSLHGAAIGILLAALLLIALLLCFSFRCKEKEFVQFACTDGSPKLMSYNEEGGISDCKSAPQLYQSQSGIYQEVNPDMTRVQEWIYPSSADHFANLKRGSVKSPNGIYQGLMPEMNTFESQPYLSADHFANLNRANVKGWTKNRNNTYNNTRSGFTRSFRSVSDWNVEEHIGRKLYNLSVEQQDFPEYYPHEYSAEETNNEVVTLDKLSIYSTEDDLDFLQNLGPKFCTLDMICQQGLKEKNMNFIQN
ncbi:cadherin-like protein 26 [Clarias magur]|uniref:Cadherin-like protein 26 n=1 Tax=Clarias magur TaxID=1594786 RepID=A0A8J4X543_CLAMG|nr:cadherin-like protein 26 [Clarias magur]